MAAVYHAAPRVFRHMNTKTQPTPLASLRVLRYARRVFQLPDRLDTEVLHSTAPVFAQWIDRLRVVVQRKLGWDPFRTRECFAPFKHEARTGTLTQGNLLTHVLHDHGAEAALVILRALVWFTNEPAMKRAHRKQFHPTNYV